MVQCEMCGTETGSATTSKIEGAELQVCQSCADFGTEVTPADASSTSTKYSTSDSGSTSTQSTNSSGGNSGTTRAQRRDLFDEMEMLADDYPERIREVRETRDLSQEDLARELNEKASLIRKLERGDMQPSDSIQRKLERHLEISLTEGSGDADDEWESDVEAGATTLGDVVRRRE